MGDQWDWRMPLPQAGPLAATGPQAEGQSSHKQKANLSRVLLLVAEGCTTVGSAEPPTMLVPTSPHEPDPSVCSIRQQVFPGESFPMSCPCYYCGQSPPDHHGRCCHHKQHDFPESVWTTSGKQAKGSVGDNAAVPKPPPPVLEVADRPSKSWQNKRWLKTPITSASRRRRKAKV